jgi:hypothetical protein
MQYTVTVTAANGQTRQRMMEFAANVQHFHVRIVAATGTPRGDGDVQMHPFPRAGYATRVLGTSAFGV